MSCPVPQEKGYFSANLPRDIQPFCIEEWSDGRQMILLANPESSFQEKKFLIVGMGENVERPDKLVYVGKCNGGYIFEVK